MLWTRVSPDPNHIIRPRLLSDRRYGVSEAVLTDPFQAHHRVELAKGEIVGSAAFNDSFSGERLYVDDKLVLLAADDREWSLQPTAAGHRFGLQDADLGATSQRSEIGSNQVTFGPGVEVWQSWTSEILVRDGFEHLGGSGNWAIVAQWQGMDVSDPGALSPPLAFDYCNNAFRIITRSDTDFSNGSAVAVVRFTDELPVGPQNYVCRFVPGADGEIQVWRNGVEIVNLACPIGYYNHPLPQVCLQWGLYRKRLALSAAVTTSNMRWGLTDLSDKIGDPDPV